MEKCRVFILYSNRLFAEGVESLLQQEFDSVQVVGIETCGDAALALIPLLQPNVVVIDTDDRSRCIEEIVPRILESHLAMRVVCLSMGDNNIDVYHRHQVLATRKEDLVEAIQMA